MNRRRLLASTVIATLFSLGAHSQRLTDAQIDEAIKAGQSKKFSQHVSDCTAGAGFGADLAANMAGGVQDNGAYNVTISANFGRVAFLAANAKRLYLPFSGASVPEPIRTAPTVFVHAEPQNPSRSDKTISVAAPVERIVIKSKTVETAVLQPVTFETEPVEWSNLLGGKVQGNRGIATFSLAEFLELPPGDIDIVLVTTGGERRCKIGKGDQTKIFGRK
jgi:hypothetical protein